MMGIQRWTPTGSEIDLAENGEFVLFADHEWVVADYERMIREFQGALALGRLPTDEVMGALDRLRAELAAKSKDAERYRWLQMQSPYRFKKIQDACVIDSVDVLYFKADRFDELLDTAMGEGNGR